MSWIHDVVDWVGGYPYEYASVWAITDFYEHDGFVRVKVRENSSYGCHQLVFSAFDERILRSWPAPPQRGVVCSGSRMKVLIVSFAFPPSNVIGAIRVGKLARYLDGRGHDLRVLTTDIVDDRSLPLEISPGRVILYRLPPAQGLARAIGSPVAPQSEMPSGGRHSERGGSCDRRVGVDRLGKPFVGSISGWSIFPICGPTGLRRRFAPAVA